MMFTTEDRHALHALLGKVTQMDIDVSRLKASADHARSTIEALTKLVAAALEANHDGVKAQVQAHLDQITSDLELKAKEADDLVAKATPQPAPAAPPGPS